MKMFKKSTMSLALSVAMAAGALVGVSAPVQAVDISTSGLGSALVFPYYTTREGYSTQFNITNTSNRTTAVKVRWREALNSRDALDFIVILSPYDVWTANVSDNGTGAQLTTLDNSCTVPNLQTINNTRAFSSVAFNNFFPANAPAQLNADTGSTSLDRTREGYFEVISEGVTHTEQELIAVWGKHNAVGNNTAVPNRCDLINNAWASNLNGVQAQFAPGIDNLKGRAQIINVATSMGIGYDPMTLVEFNDQVNLISASGGNAPSLDDAFNPFGAGYLAVNDILGRSGVINDYNLTNGSITDWVLTFPTKNFSVDNFATPIAGNQFGANPLAPFAEAFGSNQLGKSCFPVGIALWDREEYQIPHNPDDENQFSPIEPGGNPDTPELCYEANILSFGGDPISQGDVVGIFGSKVGKVITDNLLPAESGWAMIDFAGQNLPVIGMRMEKRINTFNTALNFGFAHDHAYLPPVMQVTPPN